MDGVPHSLNDGLDEIDFCGYIVINCRPDADKKVLDACPDVGEKCCNAIYDTCKEVFDTVPDTDKKFLIAFQTFTQNSFTSSRLVPKMLHSTFI